MQSIYDTLICYTIIVYSIQDGAVVRVVLVVAGGEDAHQRLVVHHLGGTTCLTLLV